MTISKEVPKLDFAQIAALMLKIAIFQIQENQAKKEEMAYARNPVS
jgi:hypothetical protein